MEKTEKISIGHFAFSMDEKAYQSVKNYLEQLEAHYHGQADGAEIMDSIEARIAELLYERCGREGVASEEDILSIIAILGYPENFDNTVGTTASQPSESAKEDRNRSGRKIYRNAEDKKLGGVCGGLSKAMNIDPLWLRLAFVAITVLGLFCMESPLCHISYSYAEFLFWLAPLIYCILWICLPKATSARQRWEMRGESGSVEDIGRNARSEREQSRSERYDLPKRNGRGCLAVGFGIILLLIGFFGLLTKITVLGSTLFATNLAFGITWWIPGMGLINSLLNALPIANVLVNPWLQTMWSLLIIIPSVLCIYGGIILVFDIKTPNWRPGLCLILLWMLLAIGMIPATFVSFRRNKPTIEKIEKVLSDHDIDITISGNLVKDFKELQEWMDKHNFDTDEWDELNEWLEEHNFDEDDLPEMQEWLEEHNLAEPDTLYCPADSLFSQNSMQIQRQESQDTSSKSVIAGIPIALVSTLLVATAL